MLHPFSARLSLQCPCNVLHVWVAAQLRRGHLQASGRLVLVDGGVLGILWRLVWVVLVALVWLGVATGRQLGGCVRVRARCCGGTCAAALVVAWKQCIISSTSVCQAWSGVNWLISCCKWRARGLAGMVASVGIAGCLCNLMTLTCLLRTLLMRG
eukprot:5442879-Amphidinium_carterae.7